MTNQKNKTDLAIIIPTIGLSKYVLNLLKTVCGKYKKQALIIWNGGTDQELCELEKEIDPAWVSVVSQGVNLGVARSWNLGIKWGIEEHNADYTVILNNDILLQKFCLDNIIDTIKRTNIPLVSGYDVAKECNNPDDVLLMRTEDDIKIVDNPQFSCFAVDNKFFAKLAKIELDSEPYPGFFDENFYPAYFEDNDFHFRLRRVKERGVYTNQALYFHFGSRTIREIPDIKNQVNETYLTNRDYFEKKWGGLPEKEKYLKPFNK